MADIVEGAIPDGYVLHTSPPTPEQIMEYVRRYVGDVIEIPHDSELWAAGYRWAVRPRNSRQVDHGG